MTESLRPAYVHGTSSVPLIGQTIGARFDHIVAKHRDCEAVVSRHQNVRYTYLQLHHEVERCARGLLALGVAKGDRVGIWSPNRAEWLVVQYATAKIGAILVNINPAYRLRELEYALAQAGVAVLIASRGFRATDYTAMLRDLKVLGPAPLPVRSLPQLRHLVLFDGESQSGAAPEDQMQRWADVLRLGDAIDPRELRAREAQCEFDEPINIQYTSGTTGTPKGATLTHHNILNNGFFIGERLRLTPTDRICLPVPFYHCFGMVLGNLAAMTHGAAIVLPGQAFDAGECLEAVQAEECTALYGVPMMFIAELQHPDFGRYRLDTLRTGIMAGSPCPIEVMRQVIDRMQMREVTICYGMTETSPVSFQSQVDDPVDVRVSTVGCIHPHVEVKITDPASGRTLARGETGELCTRGYVVMLGYWNNPQATHESIDQAHWMHTGDLAVMREDGYVNIVGRIKDMIIRGGENLYPREIEEFLYTHPKIVDVQVIGVPDAIYGEEVCAWVRLKAGETASVEEIREFCRGQIATCKIPRYVRFTTEFPMTVTGKIQKFRMREMSITELGLGAVGAIRTA
jgi:fatty-acyl-CoA synthase